MKMNLRHTLSMFRKRNERDNKWETEIGQIIRLYWDDVDLMRMRYCYSYRYSNEICAKRPNARENCAKTIPYTYTHILSPAATAN